MLLVATFTLSYLGLFNELNETARKSQLETSNRPRISQERIENISSVAHLNVRSVASRENLYLLKQTVTNNHFDIFTVSGSWLDPTVYDADILFRQIRLSGKIKGHTEEAVDYLSMLKTSTRPAWLKNGPQCLKPTFNNYGWKCCVRNLSLFFYVRFTGYRMPQSIS